MYKNLVIISIDSLRADATNFSHQAIHGRAEPRLKTPNLDKLAGQGSYIEKAYSTNTYTTAAHASLFTGRYPYQHQVRAFLDFHSTLNPTTPTLAEILHNQGFQTFFYSDVPELFSSNDIWRGFRVKTKNNTNWFFNSLEEAKKDRNFIFLHLFDVHEPYLYIEDQNHKPNANDDYYDSVTTLQKKLGYKSKLNPKKNPHDFWQEIRQHFRAEHLKEYPYLYPLYLAGVNYFDKYRLPYFLNQFDHLGYTSDNTLFIFLSDHGEGQTTFDTNNIIKFNHGGDITEDVLRIFLTISESGINRKLMSIADLSNLALSLLGVPYPKPIEYSLSRAVIPPHHLYAESHYNIVGDKLAHGLTDQGTLAQITSHVLGSRAFITDSHKYILHGEPEYLASSHSTEPASVVIDRLFQSIFYRFSDSTSKKSLLGAHAHSPLEPDALAYKLLISPEKTLKPFTESFETTDLADHPIDDTSWTIQAKFHWLSALTTHVLHPRRHYRFSKLINNY
ncbi:MAG: sulfatase-like hydrolase/transferase [bacterium]